MSGLCFIGYMFPLCCLGQVPYIRFVRINHSSIFDSKYWRRSCCIRRVEIRWAQRQEAGTPLPLRVEAVARFHSTHFQFQAWENIHHAKSQSRRGYGTMNRLADLQRGK